MIIDDELIDKISNKNKYFIFRGDEAVLTTGEIETILVAFANQNPQFLFAIEALMYIFETYDAIKKGDGNEALVIGGRELFDSLLQEYKQQSTFKSIRQEP